MELFALVDRKPIVGNLSPPSRAPAMPASPLDHQGGLSLWLRAGIFALALLAAARPDRWAWSLPSLHDVLLGIFAWSIVGDFISAFLVIPAMIVISAVVCGLLCFDRIVYVPAYRLARGRFRLCALAAFTAAVAIEGIVAGGLIFAVRHRARPTEGAAPASVVIVRHPTRSKARLLTGALK